MGSGVNATRQATLFIFLRVRELKIYIGFLLYLVFTLHYIIITIDVENIYYFQHLKILKSLNKEKFHYAVPWPF